MPATHTWTGADGPLWSDAGNWKGGAPTEAGAVLVFPAGASSLMSTNDLSGATIGSILFTGGGYSIGGNPVTLLGGISTAAGTTGVDTINASVAMSGDQTISIASTKSTVVLGGVVSGAAGLNKVGNGLLVLSGTNTYSGITDVAAGVLDIQSTSALGQTSGGTVVARGAALDVEGGISVAEPVTLSGSGPDGAGAFCSVGGANLWTAPITLQSSDATIGVTSGSTLTLRGVLSGPGGLTKDGLGFLVEQMFAANTYSSPTTVTAGSVLLDTVGGVAVPGALLIEPSAGSGTVTVGCGRDNRTAPSSTLTIAENGVLDLMNHSITFASVTLDGGTITTGDRGELDLGGNVTATAGTSSTIAGFVSLGQTSRTVTVGAGGLVAITAAVDGGGGLIKNGAGRIVLSGDDTFTGTTVITGGTLTADGSLADEVVVGPGGTLDGSGSIQSLVALGGTVRPSDGSHSLTVSGAAVLGAGSTFSAIVSGPPLVVGGLVRIEGATLSTDGSTPNPGHALTLIRNQGIAPVAGSFAGLPEGATFVAAGQTFRISYAGGAGNDVVLTVVTGGTVTLTAGRDRLASGMRVVPQATVTSAVPGGTVSTAAVSSFDGSVARQPAPLIPNSATLTTAALAVGPNVLASDITGNGDLGPRTSTLTVNRIGNSGERSIGHADHAVHVRPAEPAGLAFWVRKLKRGSHHSRILRDRSQARFLDLIEKPSTIDENDLNALASAPCARPTHGVRARIPPAATNCIHHG